MLPLAVDQQDHLHARTGRRRHGHHVQALSVLGHHQIVRHRYEIDEDGLVAAAQIVPPTSQNQAAIEDDLTQLVTAQADLDDAALTGLCERTIRNYDPCISCATHFLTVTVTRR
jgi:coenzyme F420-reducing hydrogenase alpha subunit